MLKTATGVLLQSATAERLYHSSTQAVSRFQTGHTCFWDNGSYTPINPGQDLEVDEMRRKFDTEFHEQYLSVLRGGLDDHIVLRAGWSAKPVHDGLVGVEQFGTIDSWLIRIRTAQRGLGRIGLMVCSQNVIVSATMTTARDRLMTDKQARELCEIIENDGSQNS